VNAELEALHAVVARLESAGIPYMLTGSVAMSYYAEPRMTRDIDLVVELAPGDEQRVMQLFEPDYYVSEEAVRSAIADRRMFNLFDMARLVKIDLVVRKEDEFRHHEFARRRKYPLGGKGIWLVSKEDLILSKLAWAANSQSETQLGDVRRLLASGADGAYLREWSDKLGVEDLLRKCLDAGHGA
jgi:hypothetical protein